MHVLFCHDTYYMQGPAQETYSYGAFPYALWAQRFLPHFDKMTILGREKAFDPAAADGLDVSSGENVEYILLPNINTPFKRLMRGRELFSHIKEEVTRADAVIIRGPVEFGMMAATAARQLGKPYAVEMSGCAFDNVWNHGSWLGKIYAPFKCWRAKQMVKHADQVMYVTEQFLQDIYPTNGHAEYASNAELDLLDENVLEARLATIIAEPQRLVFGMIGNLGNKLKGLDIALQALCMVKDALPPFELRLLGQGDAAQWEARIGALGLNDRVVFSGTCKGGTAVVAWLDEIDVYLQPSFHEGLPRGLIEAMSRGAPALASNAGGIPELLSAQFIHKKGDTQALAAHILELSCDAALRQKAVQENFKKAGAYTKDKLDPRRAAFWARFADVMKAQATT